MKSSIWNFIRSGNAVPYVHIMLSTVGSVIVVERDKTCEESGDAGPDSRPRNESPREPAPPILILP